MQHQHTICMALIIGVCQYWCVVIRNTPFFWRHVVASRLGETCAFSCRNQGDAWNPFTGTCLEHVVALFGDAPVTSLTLRGPLDGVGEYNLVPSRLSSIFSVGQQTTWTLSFSPLSSLPSASPLVRASRGALHCPVLDSSASTSASGSQSPPTQMWLTSRLRSTGVLAVAPGDSPLQPPASGFEPPGPCRSPSYRSVSCDGGTSGRCALPPQLHR
ncbi:hypothetical protein BD413DRAFT_313515 [Trametes elegans]|nr:hypothetical protein BD413DRAFT_313515 [Trametes elegans]